MCGQVTGSAEIAATRERGQGWDGSDTCADALRSGARVQCASEQRQGECRSHLNPTYWKRWLPRNGQRVSALIDVRCGLALSTAVTVTTVSISGLQCVSQWCDLRLGRPRIDPVWLSTIMWSAVNISKAKPIHTTHAANRPRTSQHAANAPALELYVAHKCSAKLEQCNCKFSCPSNASLFQHDSGQALAIPPPILTIAHYHSTIRSSSF